MFFAQEGTDDPSNPTISEELSEAVDAVQAAHATWPHIDHPYYLYGLILIAVVSVAGGIIYTIIMVIAFQKNKIQGLVPNKDVIRFSFVLLIVFVFVVMFLSSQGQVDETATTFLASIAAYVLGTTQAPKNEATTPPSDGDSPDNDANPAKPTEGNTGRPAGG